MAKKVKEEEAPEAVAEAPRDEVLVLADRVAESVVLAFDRASARVHKGCENPGVVATLLSQELDRCGFQTWRDVLLREGVSILLAKE